ncbi:Hypothetical predicted protein [Olea europaea subsp. europaea]|uniref:Uncharacterized protein n=1 Tax=Olea europaea subsp. europaea TaxID=158383 RepID=A0A8S0Q902_OLEEU|nr:Hypothetical predicted protein [Olea europaea subsp. europaea]
MLKSYTSSQLYPYSLHGFSLAVMIEVHCTLNPTNDELLKPFWKEFRPFDDEADPKMYNVASKDEGEKKSESDDALSSFARPQCPKTSDLPSEARQDEVTEKADGTKEDSNISNEDDSGKPSTSSHVCQPNNEIIVIEEPNSEMAVRRGHRVKRRGAVLLSPYTNPLKRRKLLNIQVYDLLREVDPAKVEDINKWLANASTSDIVSLTIYEVGRKFFDELLKDDECLSMM